MKIIKKTLRFIIYWSEVLYFLRGFYVLIRDWNIFLTPTYEILTFDGLNAIGGLLLIVYTIIFLLRDFYAWVFEDDVE